jgi:hypothetical protein
MKLERSYFRRGRGPAGVGEKGQEMVMGRGFELDISTLYTCVKMS